MRQREVEEVGDAWAKRDFGDLATGAAVWRHDAVGAGLDELGFGLLVVGASDDEQVRLQGTRGQRHVDVVGVGVGGRDQAASALDAGLFEHRVVRRVAGDHEHAIGGRPFDRDGVDVDDDEANLGVTQLARDGASHPTVAAQDEVPAQPLDRFRHPAPLQSSADRLGNECLGDETDRAEDDRNAADRQDASPQPAHAVELAHFLEADRGQRDDRHVERVADRPVHEHKPGRTHRRDKGDYRQPQRHDAPDPPLTRTASAQPEPVRQHLGQRRLPLAALADHFC